MLFSVSNVDGLTADCCKTGECGKTAVHDTNGACGESSVCRKSVNFGESSDKGEFGDWRVPGGAKAGNEARTWFNV